MSRYRVRRLVSVFGLLVLGFFMLGVSPAVQELTDRMDALEAESDSGFVVVDSVE